MRNWVVALIVLWAVGQAPASAFAAPGAVEVLAADRAASGGEAWGRHAALRVEYAYAGQGLTGKVTSVTDLRTGRFVDTVAVGPASQAQGFDGVQAWARDISGAVTLQGGGDERQLAINEAYRRANLWWRADFGGAVVVSDGEKTEGGATYDVLTVTPRNGKPFDAWFDARTHLLARVVEVQGPQTSITTLSDNRPVDGVVLPHAILIGVGEAKYDQVMKVVSVAFQPTPPDAAFAPPANKTADATIADGGTETTIPFDLFNNHIYARVEVNGKPFTFLFDTGGQDLLTRSTAKALGLASEGSVQGGGSGEGHVEFGLTKVQTLRIGAATLRDQVFPVVALDAFSAVEGVPQEGIVGFEIFRRFVTRIDYGAGRLTLIDPKMFDPKDAGVAIPFAVYGTNITVQASYDGHAGAFIVDTGGRASVRLSVPFARANHIDADSAGTVAGVTGWGFGGPSRAIVTRADRFTLGPFTLRGKIAEIATDKGGSFADASIAGSVGGGFLKRYVVTLDYDHAVMYLRPVTAPVADLDTFDRAGLWFNADQEGYRIFDVIKGAPADQAGLLVDDVIVAVDGAPARSIPLYEMRRLLRDRSPGTVVAFTVMRGGATRIIQVKLRDLV